MGNSNSKEGFKCQRCFTKYKSENDKVELSCKHLSCKNCIILYTIRALRDSDLSQIKCPVRADCMAIVTIGILRLILEERDFQRYELLVLMNMPPQEIRIPRPPEPLQGRVTRSPEPLQRNNNIRIPVLNKGIRLPCQLPPQPTPTSYTRIVIKKV
jgi:hypothetical protein